VSQNALPSFAA
jgi:hypothetical protein